MRTLREVAVGADPAYERLLDNKVPPEAKAAVIVERAKAGDYAVLHEQVDAGS